MATQALSVPAAASIGQRFPSERKVVSDPVTGSRSLYLVDRRTNEMMLLATGHKQSAADHPHPTFSPDNVADHARL